MVYLVPSALHEEGLDALPASNLDAIRSCNVFFVENERSARRFLKKIWKEMVIDDYEWHVIGSDDIATRSHFIKCLDAGKTIGILSEAGCPGVADPGQQLVALAQERAIPVKPLTGPNSILLGLMGSGLNGQSFRFLGYLPIDTQARQQAIRSLESEAHRSGCTQIFIETPYRNNQVMEALLNYCQPATRVCLAVDLTSPNEMIRTKTVAEWKKSVPDLHKKPAIFLVGR